MSCPTDYVEIRRQNDHGFLMNNITHNGEFWLENDVAVSLCDQNINCDGFLQRDHDDMLLMRHGMTEGTHFTANLSGNNAYTWCVKKAMIDDLPSDDVLTISSFTSVSNRSQVACDPNTTEWRDGKCKSTVDITSDNANVCDTTTTEFRDGKCVSIVDIASDNANVCDTTTTEFRDGKCVSTVNPMCQIM